MTKQKLLITLALLYAAPITPAGAQILIEGAPTLIEGTQIRFNLEGKDTVFQRGRSGAVLEQYNTAAWNDVLSTTDDVLNQQEESIVLRQYVRSKLPKRATADDFQKAYLKYVTPPISPDMPVVVHVVAPGSPAERAGLRKGDIINAIDDLKTEGKTLPIIRAASTGKPGKTINLSLSRREDGVLKPLTISVPLVELHPSTLLDVNRSNFRKEVAKSKIPVFIAWKADWCPWCIKDEPTLEFLKLHYAGQIKFVRIDSDDSPHLIDFLGERETVPSSIVYVPGESEHVALLGSHSKEVFVALLDEQLEDLQMERLYEERWEKMCIDFSAFSFVVGLTLGVCAGVFVRKKIRDAVIMEKAHPFTWTDSTLLKVSAMILCVVSFAFGWSSGLILLCGPSVLGFGFVAGYWAKRTDVLRLPATA
jgi:thioredoxin 1